LSFVANVVSLYFFVDFWSIFMQKSMFFLCFVLLASRFLCNLENLTKHCILQCFVPFSVFSFFVFCRKKGKKSTQEGDVEKTPKSDPKWDPKVAKMTKKSTRGDPKITKIAQKSSFRGVRKKAEKKKRRKRKKDPFRIGPDLAGERKAHFESDDATFLSAICCWDLMV